jgi:sugar lactone lactonase YvrE
VYVTRAAKSTNQISVYNITTFQLIRYITVPGATGNLYGLAASSANNYLFVADYDNSFVYRVNLSSASDGNTTVIKWSVATNPNGLSINGQLNVLVATDSKKVQEFTPEGSLVRQITDGSILNHAVEVKPDIWAVSRYGPVHGVALIAVNGTVLYTYGSTTRGSGPGMMSWPSYLTVDSQGYILVADLANNRILILNPTLSQSRTLALPQIKQPFGLHMDESRGLLFIGESGSPYRVLEIANVFNLRTAFSS